MTLPHHSKKPNKQETADVCVTLIKGTVSDTNNALMQPAGGAHAYSRYSPTSCTSAPNLHHDCYDVNNMLLFVALEIQSLSDIQIFS